MKYKKKKKLVEKEIKHVVTRGRGWGEGKLEEGGQNIQTFRDFPGGVVVKNLPANAGDTDLSPGPGRSHMPRSN